MNPPVSLPHDWFAREVPPNVHIGERSWVYSSFAFLHFRSTRDPAVRIGRACGVYNGTFFDLGPRGTIEIGDYCTFVGVIVACNTAVRVGNYCFLAHRVVLGDSGVARPWRHGDSSSSPEANGDGESIVLGEDVWVGAGAVLLQGARIGDGAIVGAGTVVDFEVPPLSIVAGNPARIVGRAAGR